MTFPPTIGAPGWIVALVSLIVVIVLMMTGALPVWPLGVLLAALALSRLI